MGLYINATNNKNIYKNDGSIQAPNQGVFIKNNVSEMIQEQQRINKSLLRSFHEISNRKEQQEYKNSLRWEELGIQLKQLEKMNAQHAEMENEMMQRLNKIDADHQKLQVLIEEDRLSEQQVREQLTQLNASQEIISQMLEGVSQVNEQLVLKMDQQTSVQERMSEQISTQDNSNEAVTKRLDNQEAMMEKITRQVDYFRSLLFERTNYLSEKMEQTSSYILSMISGSAQLQKNYLLSQKQREKEKSNK
ncbi:hypothetical protein ACFOUV_10610 [Oceanobacillus longus]|uniref:Uncharacterized protein n=1 Tax=Oceanobacillus longus TaxID=930120 RepID=A0ABV8GWP8_9BACI